MKGEKGPKTGKVEKVKKEVKPPAPLVDEFDKKKKEITIDPVYQKKFNDVKLIR